MNDLRLLGIFAHPDDESFGSGGMLAKYAREGVEVHVCIVTDGASGSYDPEAAQPAGASELAALRRQELACAASALKVHLHMLGYRDSGMEGAPDNHHPQSLYQANLDQVARELIKLIYRVRPHVIVTHDPTGGYFHPDHIRVNHAVHLAWRALNEPDSYPELLPPAPEGAPWRPQKLYYGVLPRSALRWFIFAARLSGKDPRRFGRNQDIDLTALGFPDRDIHVRLDILPYAAVKEQASTCHASQGGGGGPPRMPVILRRRMQRHEYYVQAYPPGARRHGDLFEGLR